MFRSCLLLVGALAAAVTLALVARPFRASTTPGEVVGAPLPETGAPIAQVPVDVARAVLATSIPNDPVLLDNDPSSSTNTIDVATNYRGPGDKWVLHTYKTLSLGIDRILLDYPEVRPASVAEQLERMRALTNLINAQRFHYLGPPELAPAARELLHTPSVRYSRIDMPEVVMIFQLSREEFPELFALGARNEWEEAQAVAEQQPGQRDRPRGVR